MVEEPQTEAVKESTDRQPLANLGQLCIESFHSPDFSSLFFSHSKELQKIASADLFFCNKNRDFFGGFSTLKIVDQMSPILIYLF